MGSPGEAAILWTRYRKAFASILISHLCKHVHTKQAAEVARWGVVSSTPADSPPVQAIGLAEPNVKGSDRAGRRDDAVAFVGSIGTLEN